VSLAFQHASDEDFKETLEKYRAGENYKFPPTAKELSSKLGKVVFTEDNLTAKLAHGIIMFGWDEAITRALNWQLGLGTELDTAVRDYMIRTGITALSEPFFGFPFWFNVFVMKLHDGEIIDAYAYAGKEASKSARSYYIQKHKYFEHCGNEYAKTYFTYFKMEKTNNYNGKYLQHFRSFKLKKASEAYGMTENETQEYKQKQIDIITNSDKLINEEDIPF
jgi:hypothetical protein